MSGVVIQRLNKDRPWQKSRVNKRPGEQMSGIQANGICIDL